MLQDVLEFFPQSFHPMNTSQQIEVVQLIPILQDITLHLTTIDPCDKIFHITGDEKSRVGDDFGSDANMALFDEFDCLANERSTPMASRESRKHGGKEEYILTPETVSLILNLVITTPNLRLHILLTPTFRSTSLNLTPSLTRPTSYSFSNSNFSCLSLTGSVGSRFESE